jgi:3',5'-cyclic AMP phosphodiesterase CpdA
MHDMTRRSWVSFALLAALVFAPWALAAAPPPAPAAPAPSAWSGPFFFIQMSDPQMGFIANNKDFAKETELLGKAVAAANRLRPAFVVITGDLVHQPGDAAQIAEFQRLTGQLDKAVPLHLVSGNHDLIDKTRGLLLEEWRKRFGPDWYAFDHGGCHFVVLDTSILGRPDAAAEADRQLAWARDDLAKAAARRPRHLLVFQHHPLFLKQPDEKDAYAVVPGAQRKIYLDLFQQHGVRAVFAGHAHFNVLGKAGGVEMVTTGGVGKPLGKDPSGFRIVKVYEDRLEHEYVSLEKPPEKVTLEVPK